jgi:small GTP-binding protein
MYGQFSTDYGNTLGIDYFTKRVAFGDSVFSVRIWDTAGQEQYQSLIPTYIRGTQVAILVYDVSSRPSFEAARVWYDTVIDKRGDEARCVLAGNKADLDVKVEESVVKQFADQHSLQHVKVSAK